MRIRPSAGHQWSKCAGSVAMQQSYPDDETDAARESTACHEIAERIIKPYQKFNGELTSSTDFIGTLAENGVLITDEMYQAAVEYVTDILKYCNSTGLLKSVKIEQSLLINKIYPSEYGTPDAWVYNPGELEIVLWDLKYGYGIVEPFENPQLICYVAGIIQHLEISGMDDQALTVKMRIVQPRAFHQDGSIREWSCTALDLRGYINQLSAAAFAAKSPNTSCNAGTHCRYCTARHACESLQQTIYNAIDVIGGSSPVELSGVGLAIEYQLMKRVVNLVTYRLSGLEAQALAELKSGNILPGLKAKSCYGRTRWKKDTPIDQLIMMGDLMGVDLRKPIALDTPSQAKKKGLDESVINQYSVTPMTGFKLSIDDGSHIRRSFKGN